MARLNRRITLYLKRFVPRSLYLRFFLIIIVPMVLVQAVATYMFYERHWSSMNRNLSASLAGEVGLVVRQITDSDREKWDEIFLIARRYMNFKIKFYKGAELVSMAERSERVPKDYKLFAKALENYFSFSFIITPLRETGDINISIKIPGGVLDIMTTRKRLASPTTYIFIMWMVGTAIVLLSVALMFMRNQVRSIVRLTEAAEKFGKGQDMPNFKPQGAKEIRLAAIAFIEMRERIRRLITRRTKMLASVSHDLRTPLTRMKLQLEMMKKNKETKGMKDDVAEMEKMLEGYLEFARTEISGESKEATVDIKLYDFIKDLIDGYRNYKVKIKSDIPSGIILHGKISSLKRCFANFIDNALRYASKVEISAERKPGGYAFISIDDNGPGIIKSEHSNVFQPFYRLESSRNKETGGVGLGMSIARDIIHAHGGEVSLAKSKMGGLRVIITLPL